MSDPQSPLGRATAVEGWRRLGRNEFLNPAGETVSRRQYDNARAQAAGWRNYAEFQRFAGGPAAAEPRTAGERRLHGFYQWGASELEVRSGASVRELRKVDSDYNRRFTAFLGEWDALGDSTLLRRGEGALADLLTFIGRRDPEFEGDVGES